MSRWRIIRCLECPLDLLRGNAQTVPLEVTGPLIRLEVSDRACASGESSSVFANVLDIAAAHGFHVAGDTSGMPDVPAPWRIWSHPAAGSDARDLLGAELARELWLLPVHDIADLEGARKQLDQRRAALPEQVREALAYWLLFSAHPPEGRPDLKRSWRADTDEVLVMRSPDWRSRRSPPEPLLDTAQKLMVGLVTLRNEPATLSRYESLVAELDRRLPPLPQAYCQAIWWEAGYQLAARGLREEADEATRRYRASSDRLHALMPGLADGHIPGYGVSIGQRAYYAGRFPEALDAYRKEWESGSDRHRARLQRLLADLLTDLGMLGKAEQYAKNGLTAQEISGDHETFKTRGRLAEIFLRSGRLEEASALYQQSLDDQEAVFGCDGIDGQTLTYLGHVACLAGRLEEADAFYQRALAADERQDGRLNAYALMGKVALALQRADRDVVLALLAKLDAADRSAINGDSLPCGLIRIAGVMAGAPREQGLSALESMLKDNYIIEALASLPALFRQYGMADKRIGQISERLKEWDKAIDRHQGLAGPQEAGESSPRWLLQAIEQMRKQQRLVLPDELRRRVFPTNLILGPLLDSGGDRLFGNSATSSGQVHPGASG